MALHIYNTLTRTKEKFEPLHPPHVGMYVCGPTVYSDVHLGNCRTFISFDIIYRYLKFSGYKVRYVRNITDAGHLEGDRDEGEDKFAKKARLEQVEPMEIVQRYTKGFQEVMRLFNCENPSIEPTATGHILEQIEMTQTIINKGFAYEVDGTIYFDVEKYNRQKPYGILTNRKLEDLLEGTRELGGQDEKHGRLDFALWIKAKPEHLMQWQSPWGMGFPGWHIECSAMSKKYLGSQFDIHGGGMDLAATHHTNEIAQNEACYNTSPAKVWMHTNMLTVNGTRMSKSLGNGFLPHELFTGNHPLLEKAYSPMTVRFFMLQSHYRSTLDFSNEALQAGEKGFGKLALILKRAKAIKPNHNSFKNIDYQINQKLEKFKDDLVTMMNDDFNTAKAIAHMFSLNDFIEKIYKKLYTEGEIIVEMTVLKNFIKTFETFTHDVFGLKFTGIKLQKLEKFETNQNKPIENKKADELLQLLINLRKEAKAKKDFATSDLIRNQLAEKGIQLKDEKDGTVSWNVM